MSDKHLIDNEEQLSGKWTPLETSAATTQSPNGAPALMVPHDVPLLFSGSLSPYIQHDSSFVGTQVGKNRIPSNSLMPFGPQNNPQINAANQSAIDASSSGKTTKVSFGDITTGDNTGSLMRVAGLSVLTYYQTGIVNANEIGGINVAGNTPDHAGQVLVSNDGNLTATWQDGLLYLKVTDYGAVGGGKIAFSDIKITSGTPNLISPQAPWVVGDVGKTIMVAGAGPNNTDLWTTILAFVDTSHVTLAANASSTVNPSTSVQFNAAVWGATDDTAAINACIAEAGLLGLLVYIPAGVYIYSSPLTQPATSPTCIFGDGNDTSILVAQNPGIAAYAGFMAWTANSTPTGLSHLNIIGGSYARNGSPTAGAEVQLYTLASVIEDCSVYNTSFLMGFDIQNSFSTITGMFDVGQSRYQLDTTTVSGCQAAGFLGGGPIGGEGGAFISCLAAGDWPITYNYDFDTSGGGLTANVSFINCIGGSGALTPVTPRGFHLIKGMSAVNCYVEDSQVAFVVGEGGSIRDCRTTPQGGQTTGVATVVVSNGEIPYTYGAARQYYLADQIIDTNGNYQQVTTAGTTAGGTPVWATILAATTVDGTVTWTRIANPGYTQVVGALVDHTNDTSSSPVYSLYDLGYRTSLKSNIFTGIIRTSNPAAEVITGHVVVTTDYTTLLDDATIYVNSASAKAITLKTTNLIPGHVYLVKSISTGVVTIAGESGQIDNHASVAIPLQYIALEFEWDGTNFWIH